MLFELLKDLTFLQHKKLSFLDSNLFFQKGVGFKLNVDSNPFLSFEFFFSFCSLFNLKVKNF